MPDRLPRPPETKRSIRVVQDSYAGDAGLDTAVSRALLLRAAAGEAPETIRLHVPGRVLAFGRRDVVHPGYAAAAAAARAAGFQPVERLAGGRAAVFHQDTIAFSWTIPDPDPVPGIEARFRELSAVVAAALASLGVDARIGEVPGEYCPGEYSVNARGAVKLMGVGQRLSRRAAHVGGVIVVGGAPEIREVLVPVYRALGLVWDPATVGAVADEVPGVATADVTAALLAMLANRHDLSAGVVDASTLALAGTLRADHVAPIVGANARRR